MSNKYDLKMVQRGMMEFKNIIGAYAYLMSVGAITDIELYNEYFTKDDAGNLQDFAANIGSEHIEIIFMDSILSVMHNRLVYEIANDDGYLLVLDIKNPNEINNDESFFQASTIYDLTDIEGYEWFTTIMDGYASVMDFMESDNV